VDYFEGGGGDDEYFAVEGIELDIGYDLKWDLVSAF
jgi:hypothetical protein